MASTLSYFMTEEDERAFFRELERFKVEVYPEVVEPGYTAPFASAELLASLTEPAYYLALPAAGDAVARTLKRGRNAGMMEIDELASPVFHYERSLMEGEELRSGRIWGELEVVGDRQNKALRKPDLMRQTFEQLRDYFKKRFHKSDPPGHFVGPQAARRAKEGLVLREAGRKGAIIGVWR